MRYRIVQAMPGTDGYGWYVLTEGTDGAWYNFFGNRPLANREQVERAVSRLPKHATEVK